MSTGDKKSNIYLKKFLPQQQMTENFLEYLAKRDQENLKLQYPKQGYFVGNALVSNNPDEITAATPSKATDGQGHLLILDPSEASAKFENNNGTDYYVGMRYNVRERDTELNVRTGQIEYAYLQDAIGEKGEPLSVIDNGTTLTLKVDGQFEVGVNNAGRRAIIYLKRAVGQADAFYDGLVEWVGGENVVNTTHLIGQTAGLASLDPTDYWVFIPGLTIRRNSDPRLDPNFIFLGIVTGGGEGNAPSNIDTTGARVLYDGGAQTGIINMLRSFLVGGGDISWDLSTNSLEFSEDIVFKVPGLPYDYRVGAGVFGNAVPDGYCGVIQIDEIGGVRPLFIAPIEDISDDPSFQPIFYRYGDNLYFWQGALELKGDALTPTTGRFDGITQDLLFFIGAQNESDANPIYTNAISAGQRNIQLQDGESLRRALKRLDQRDDVVTKVRVVDFNAAALNMDPNPVIDGQTINDTDRVLYAHPSLNGVYEVSGVGDTVVWTKLFCFGSSQTPKLGSLVGVADGSKEFVKTIYQYKGSGNWIPVSLPAMEGDPSGFENRLSSYLGFDNPSRTFTITPDPEYFIAEKGKLFKKEIAESIQIDDVEGLHYFYFDNGVLSTTQNFDYELFLGKPLIATVYWNVADQKAVLLGDERHGVNMDARTHLFLHETMGAQWVEGLGLANTPGDGSQDADAQVSIGDGKILDEDIDLKIENLPPPTPAAFAAPWDPSSVYTYGQPGTIGNGKVLNLQVDPGGQPFISDLIKIYINFTSGEINIIVETNDGTNNGGNYVSIDSTELAELVNTGMIAGKNVSYTGDFLGILNGITATPGGAVPISSGFTGVFNGGTDSVAPDGVYGQELFPIARVPILYRSGVDGDWRKFAITDYILKKGTDRAQFNDPAGPWSIAEAPADGHHVAAWLFATNDINHPVVAIMGQRSDLTLNDALANNTFESLQMDNLPSMEMKALFRVIFQTSSAYANAVAAKLVNVVDLRKAEDTALGSYSPTAHNNLSGRNAPNAHPASSISTVLTNFKGALSTQDTESQKALDTLDKHFQQLRLKEHPSNKNRVTISAASITLNTGTILEQQLKNLILKFAGAIIDFSTGQIFEPDGTTPFNGGLNDFTPFVPASTGYAQWASVTLLPSTVNADNTINAQVLVLKGATEGATRDLAPRAVFASGVKIGQVVLIEETGSIKDILQTDITQQGTGGSSGSEGTGDAGTFELEMRAWLRRINFEWFTPNIAAKNEDDLIDDPGSTATYDIANGAFAFATIGAILKSIQLFGSRFLSSVRASDKVEMHANWYERDPAATYEVSRDGGLNWLALAMNRVGESSYYRGIGTFPDPVVVETLKEYDLSNASSQVALTNTIPKFALKLIITEKSRFNTLTLYTNKIGTPVGNLYAKIVKDNAGVPSEAAADLMGISAPLSVAGLSAGNNASIVNLPGILPAGTYWITIESDAAYQASYSIGTHAVTLRGDNTSPSYAGGDAYSFNGTVWSVVAGFHLVFKTEGYRFILLARITSSATNKSLEGFGVFFGEYGAKIVTALDESQTFSFNGAEDKTDFVMTKFLPDPSKVQALCINTGLTFEYPAFDIDGHTLKFRAGTFLFPSETQMMLKVRHREGGSGFDASNQNAALMAANGLGSQDPSIDKSAPGVGVKLKSPDGSLWHLVIQDDGSILTTKL